MRKLLPLLAALALAAPAAGAVGERPTVVKAHGSDFGRVLFDGRGYVLYAFTRDPRRRSACSGACARRWPPFLVRGKLVAASTVRGALLGTIGRTDGRRQVAYAGRPLYFYVGDRRPGQIQCQNAREFGGLWLVVRPTGMPVR